MQVIQFLDGVQLRPENRIERDVLSKCIRERYIARFGGHGSTDGLLDSVDLVFIEPKKIPAHLGEDTLNLCVDEALARDAKKTKIVPGPSLSQTRYRVITSDNEAALCEKVNRALAEGWQFVGGMSVSSQVSHDHGYRRVDSVYAQALAEDVPISPEEK